MLHDVMSHWEIPIVFPSRTHHGAEVNPTEGAMASSTVDPDLAGTAADHCVQSLVVLAATTGSFSDPKCAWQDHVARGFRSPKMDPVVEMVPCRKRDA